MDLIIDRFRLIYQVIHLIILSLSVFQFSLNNTGSSGCLNPLFPLPVADSLVAAAMRCFSLHRTECCWRALPSSRHRSSICLDLQLLMEIFRSSWKECEAHSASVINVQPFGRTPLPSTRIGGLLFSQGHGVEALDRPWAPSPVTLNTRH